MSAPDTDLEKQKKKHKTALLGIRGVMAFAAILLLGLIIWLSYQGQEPRNPETKIDGRTGEEVNID